MEDRILDLERDRDKLFVDMYYGTGRDNPPMTHRISNVEDSLSGFKAAVNKIQWIVITAVLGIVFDRIATHLKWY